MVLDITSKYVIIKPQKERRSKMKLSLNVKEPGIHDEVSEMATKEVNTSLGTNFNNSWNVDDKEWLKKHEEVSESRHHDSQR